MVSGVISYEAGDFGNLNEHVLGLDSPLVLIGGVASWSVCGRQWAECWFESPKLELPDSQKLFRFGAGPAMQSLGTTTMLIHACPETNDELIPIVIAFRADVVNSDAAMLISHESHRRTQRTIDFAARTLSIPSVATIKLFSTKSGHLAIHGDAPVCEFIGKIGITKSPCVHSGNEITHAGDVGRRNRENTRPIATLIRKHFLFDNSC